MSFPIPATEAKSIIDIEAGVYPATVAKVEPADGSFGEQVRFTFAVDGLKSVDGDPLDLWAWSSQKLNPKSKLWRWAKAITGLEPVKGEVFELESLVGKPCGLLVVREENDEGVRCRVTEVLPPKKAAAAAPGWQKPTRRDGPPEELDSCSQCPEP